MYKNHPAFEDPKDPELKLWRYMDVTRFLALLDSSSLYFCRASEFRSNDPFEGSFPKLEYEYLRKRYGEEILHNMYHTSSNMFYVNCWHLNEDESIAMWKLYSESNKGIAIKTTINNFKNSFNKTDQNIFAGKIQYIDYEKDTFYAHGEHQYNSGNLMTTYIHKRKIFEYEKEYRALYSATDPQNKVGFNINVDLSILIDEVVLAPYFPEWLFNLIEKNSKGYLPSIQLRKSVFDSKPYF